MSKIEIETIKPKRPSYMMEIDKRKVKIVATKEELETYTIAEHNAPFVFKKETNEEGKETIVPLEHSNIPEVLSKVFKNTVMTQILEPLDNCLICVDEEGRKVNTNEGDYECTKCNHFINDENDSLVKEKYPHGYCGYAVNRWIERFGSLDYRPEGLDEMQDRIRRIGEEKQPELTQEEVLRITQGITGGWADNVRESILDGSEPVQNDDIEEENDAEDTESSVL